MEIKMHETKKKIANPPFPVYIMVGKNDQRMWNISADLVA
jgi:hypothetical protein